MLGGYEKNWGADCESRRDRKKGSYGIVNKDENGGSFHEGLCTWR